MLVFKAEPYLTFLVGAMKICQIAALPKIRSVESPFLSKINSVESPFLPKIHSVELTIRRINLT